MRKYTYFFIVLFLGFQCSSHQQKQDNIYIYNDNSVFEFYDNSDDSLALSSLLFYEIHGKTIDRYILDTLLIARKHISYKLLHINRSGNYHDSVFFKHKSYLDKIDYFNTEWLKNEENLDSFWSSILPTQGGLKDTLNIFIIEPVKNSDSLIFKQVHRWYILH